MHRWFPIPAALAVVLWAVALGSLMAGGAVRSAASWAALATFLLHAGTLARFGAARAGRTVDREPEWARVQEAKHRRKGSSFAAWGLVVLGVGWGVSRVGGPATGRPSAAAWFGASLNLGFQPGMLAAEWAALAAWARLGRSTASPGPGRV